MLAAASDIKKLGPLSSFLLEHQSVFLSAQQTYKQCWPYGNPIQGHNHAPMQMAQNIHLGYETSCFYLCIVFAMTSNAVAMNISDRHVLDSEARAVHRKSLTQRYMMHFNRLYFSCLTLTTVEATSEAEQMQRFVNKTGYYWLLLIHNPGLQTMWFHQHCHLYVRLSSP